MNKDLPPFALSPMDDGKAPHRLPRAHARVQTSTGSWILRVFHGSLYVRDENRNLAEWTWVCQRTLSPELALACRDKLGLGASVTAPVPPEELLVPFFRESWPDGSQNWAGKVGRFMSHYHTLLHRTLPLFFFADGVGIMREMWNEDDVAFQWQWPSDHGALIEQGSYATFVQLASTPTKNSPLDQVEEELFGAKNLPFYHDVATEFVCGSAEQLEKLLRLVVHSDALLGQSQTTIHLGLRTESAYSRAALCSVCSSTLTTFHEYVDDEEGVAVYRWIPAPMPSRLLRLVELAIEENLPAGMNCLNNYKYEGRAGFDVTSAYGADLSMDFAPPTAHERLEAALQLREWLRGKVSESEREALLA